jgi:hypothetical protein
MRRERRADLARLLLFSGVFDGFFGDDAMIPVASSSHLCIHVSMRSLKADIYAAGNYFYSSCA